MDNTSHSSTGQAKTADDTVNASTERPTPRERQAKPQSWERAKSEDGKLGKIITTSQNNVRYAIDRLGVALTFDLFKNRPLIDGRPLQDHDVDRLWLDVDTRFKWRPRQEFFHTVAMTVARENSFHPVRDYLDGLVWDGTARLDNWLRDYFHAPDNDYVRAVSAIVLIAAVRRVRTPGCKYDELLVLESPQGDGKSTGLKSMAVYDSWFTDNLQLGASSKIIIEETAGHWIAEVPELQGLRRADWDRLKAGLSRQTDNARLSYGRLTSCRPRQFVAIGTTNGDRYLSDPTGNRRFWPVRLTPGPIDLEAIKRDRDQLWAEAAAREAAGESIRLSKDLWDAAREEQAARMREDPLDVKLADLLDGKEGRITRDTVLTVLGIDPVTVKADILPRIKAVMERLGWVPGANRGRIMVEAHYVQGWSKGTFPRGKAPPLLVVKGLHTTQPWVDVGVERPTEVKR